MSTLFLLEAPMFATLALLFFGLGVACNGDVDETGDPPEADTDTDTDTDADTDADSDADTDTAFHPTEGVWYYDEGAVVSDECGLNELIGDGEYDLEDDGAGTLTIQPHTTIPPISCSLDDTAFTCPQSYVDGVDFESMDLDAAVTIYAEMVGSFATEQQMEGVIGGTFACEGADCETARGYLGVLQLPCLVELDFVGSFVQ